jgi:type II secretory pathway component PulF
MDENTLGKKLLGTAGWLLAHVGAAVVLLSVLVKVVPHFERVFADFSLQLPVITQVLIVLSRWTCAFWWLIAPAGLIDAGVLFGLRSLPRGARWLSTLWAAVVLLGVILVLGAAIVAVGLPLAGLTHALASSSAP